MLHRKRTVAAKVKGRPTENNVIKWSRKTATDVINPANLWGTQREREIWNIIVSELYIIYLSTICFSPFVSRTTLKQIYEILFTKT